MMRAQTMTRWAAPAGPLLEWSPAAIVFGLGCAMAVERFDGRLAAILTTVAISAICIWVAWQDLTHFTISDSAVVSIAFLAIGARWGQAVETGGTPLDTALAITADMLLPGGSLFLLRECFFRWKGYDGLGLGDVKLALAGGALAGAVGFCWALFAASALALAFTGLKAVWARPISAHERIAFGAALAPALWTVWVMEQWPLLIPAGSL